MKHKLLHLFIALFIAAPLLNAQTRISNLPSAGSASDERKWGINVTGGLTAPLITDNPNNAPVKNFSGDISFEVAGEYYLPYKWAITGGYYNNTITYNFSEYGETARKESGISLGVKKYFLDGSIPIQPYLATAALFNFDKKNAIESLGTSNPNDVANFSSKLMNVRLGAGFDVYLISSLALTFDYRFYFSPGGETNITGTKNDASFTIKDKGMYHNIGIGLKVTLPFKVTSDDYSAIFDSVFGN